MSKSYHVTSKSLAKYTKKELSEMMSDPYSELAEYAKKRNVKKETREKRKALKNENK